MVVLAFQPANLVCLTYQAYKYSSIEALMAAPNTYFSLARTSLYVFSKAVDISHWSLLASIFL
jgi:hypothetical protein